MLRYYFVLDIIIISLFILNYFVLVTKTHDYVIVIAYVHIIQGIGHT